MKKILAPLKSRRKRMTRLEIAIGNWFIRKAQKFDRTPDVPYEELYSEGIRLADYLRKHFKIKE